MDCNQVRQYFLSKDGAYVDFPFGEMIEVFKIEDKMFGLLRCDKDIMNINVKCNPDDALLLRDMYHSIVPGFHMNKKHWNTIIVDGRLSDDLIKAQIDHSYNLVYETLSGYGVRVQHAL